MKIAYLAPEIPALSATFVYNEILALQALGNEILPVSVHRPSSEAKGPALSELKQKIIYLYQLPKWRVLMAHFQLLLTHPGQYLRALRTLFGDVKSQGVSTRAAAGLAYRFFFAGRLARLLLEQRITHLHVHFAHVPTDIAMYAGIMSATRFSVTAHANDIFERGWLLKEKAQRADFFATISEFNQRYLINEAGVEASKLRVIRCGVDSGIFSQKGFKPIQSPVVIGVVGRLVEKKGIDTLIDALQLLAERQFDFLLEIAGSGPLEDVLSYRAEQAGLSQFISFIGPLAHTEVAGFVSALDLFVLPCKLDSNGDMDGIPVVLMEAMMSGVPVISTKISGIPELVINGVTGVTVEPGNFQALAAAILSICKDQQIQQALTRAAAEKVQEEFCLMVNVARLNTLFHQASKTD